MRILAAAAAPAAPAAAEDPKLAYGKADSAPAPRPPPAGAAWEAGYPPLAEKLDTFTELVLVHELL